jgi:hypothetical protein
MNGYQELLSELPSNTSIGCAGISIWSRSELQERQLGYSIGAGGRSLTGVKDGDWRSSWLAIGNEDLCGDPIFIDTAAPGYPVYTAVHGEGRWEPVPIAQSLTAFREALAAVGRAAPGREDPVALEQNPLSAVERESILKEIREHNPDIDLSFWEMMLGDQPETD